MHQHESVVIVSKYSLGLFRFPLQLTDISCTSNHCCFHLLYNGCYAVLDNLYQIPFLMRCSYFSGLGTSNGSILLGLCLLLVLNQGSLVFKGNVFITTQEHG